MARVLNRCNEGVRIFWSVLCYSCLDVFVVMATIKAFAPLDMRPPGQNQGDFETPDLDSLTPNNFPTATVVSGVTPVGDNLQEISGTFPLLAIGGGNFSTTTVTGAKQFAGPTSDTPLEYELSDVRIPGNVLQQALESSNPYSLLEDTLKEADEIFGSEFADQLFSFAGDDKIRSLGGDDLAFGGTGLDFINGNKGNDTIYGGDGADTLRGGQSDDIIYGEEGNDILRGDLGNDSLWGGEGADTFILTKDSDVINDFSAAEGDIIQILASTPYSLADASGGLQIIRNEGTTTLVGVVLAGFDADASIVLI